MAWGFHIGETEAAGGEALAIGVSAASLTLVLIRAVPEHALGTTVVARILACAPSPQLYAGAALEPPRIVFDPADEAAAAALPARWKLVDPGRPFPEDALRAAPIRGRTFGMKIWRERVEMRVARLERLYELKAPESIIDDERRRIGLGLMELVSAGWTRELDPLPDHLTKTIDEVLAALEEGPSDQVLAERERSAELADLFPVEPPRLRSVSADGHVERDEDEGYGEDDDDDETS